MNEQQNPNMPVESSGKSKTVLVIIGLIILGLSGSYYYFNSTKTTEPTETTTEVNQGIPVQEESSVNETTSIKEFTIDAANYKFSLAEIKVKKGDKVKITLKNSEGFHDLVIDEFKVASEKLKDIAETSVEFVADKAGSFEYYCSVGTHRAMGMKGTLIVEE